MDVGSARAEQLDEAADARRASDRDHLHALRRQISAGATGDRLDGGPVALPLDQDDRAHAGLLREPHGRGILSRGARPPGSGER